MTSKKDQPWKVKLVSGKDVELYAVQGNKELILKVAGQFDTLKEKRIFAKQLCEFLNNAHMP